MWVDQNQVLEAQSKMSAGLPWGGSEGPCRLGSPDSPAGQSSPGGVGECSWGAGLVPQHGVARGSRWKPFQHLVGARERPASPSRAASYLTPPLCRSWRAPRLDSGTNFPAGKGGSGRESESGDHPLGWEQQDLATGSGGLRQSGLLRDGAHHACPRPAPAHWAAWPFKRPDGGPS